MGFDQIRKALKNIDNLQEKHLAGFDTKVLPDLEQQMDERRLGFCELEKAMADLMPQLKTNETLSQDPALTDMVDHLRVLLHQNKTLAARIQHHKDGLSRSIQKISKGRKAISAYGSSASHRNRSKVINLKN
jgi:hypothetical protein